MAPPCASRLLIRASTAAHVNQQAAQKHDRRLPPRTNVEIQHRSLAGKKLSLRDEFSTRNKKIFLLLTNNIDSTRLVLDPLSVARRRGRWIADQSGPNEREVFAMQDGTPPGYCSPLFAGEYSPGPKKGLTQRCLSVGPN